MKVIAYSGTLSLQKLVWAPVEPGKRAGENTLKLSMLYKLWEVINSQESSFMC